MKAKAFLANCPECGRLFAAWRGKDRCSACILDAEKKHLAIADAIERLNARTPQEIAEITGLRVGEVRRIVSEARELRHEVVLHEICAKCEERPPLPGSDFCVRCQLALHKAFGDAAKTLFTKAELIDMHGSVSNVRAALGGKRRRRLNPAPPFRIR